jgi:hypothetical protein
MTGVLIAAAIFWPSAYLFKLWEDRRMKHLDGYDVTGDTRYAVFVEIKREDVEAWEVVWLRNNDTLEDAQIAYLTFRDENRADAQCITAGEVFDQTAANVARITFDGSLWAASGILPNSAPIAEAPIMGEAA